MKRVLIAFLWIYKVFMSPLLGHSCRFYPTCSEYAAESIEQAGALRGLMLSAWRLLRCNPFSPGGYDPVPPVSCREGMS